MDDYIESRHQKIEAARRQGFALTILRLSKKGRR